MSPLRSIKPSLVILLTSVAVLAGCRDSHPEATEQISTTIQARTAQAQLLEIPHEIAVHGTVEATQIAAVSARVMAMVTAVPVNTGEQVKRGQVLVEIDPQASEGQVSQARGALSQARAALALAERNYARFKALAEVKAASELEVDMARMQYEQAAGAVEQAEGAIKAASSVAGDARVVAPFNGRVAQKMVDVGDLAAPGRPLMMVESEVGRRLAVSVPESLMANASLRPGKKLAITIDSRPDLGVLEGSVVEMTPGADPTSHSFQVKIELPIPDLPSGAAGRAQIPTQTRSIVAVPTEAILRQGGLDLVVIETVDGIAASRAVTLGRDLPNGRVEILSGLSGTETVLLGLTATPRGGARVERLS
jgi:RND family efflux transporter MFP subunit